MPNKEMRAAYCDKLIELASKDPKVVVLEADLMKASGTMGFKKAFPDRGIDAGIAEANMVGVAAGLSANGYIPFAATFGCFASRRAYDQFFLSANYAQLNVKLTGTDPGISAAFNGGTHMPFEDGPLMRMIPGLPIVEPSDAVSAAAFTDLVYRHKGSTYMRLHRKSVDPIYDESENFEIGKGKVLSDGKDAAIIALGAIEVHEAIKARGILASEGVDAAVIDILTLKPIDRELVLCYAAKTGRIVTAEDEQAAGGLGCEVSMLLTETGTACRLAMVGIHDEFGQVGTTDWLMQHYKMTAKDIAEKVMSLMK